MMNAAPDDLKIGQEPFKSTLAKQADWDSIESYYDYLRAHRAFKRINDDHLYTFGKNSLIENEQGKYSLLHPSKNWQATLTPLLSMML